MNFFCSIRAAETVQGHIGRWKYRSSVSTTFLDIKMGRLQWQIWLRISVVRRRHGSHVQRYHKTDHVGKWNVSTSHRRTGNDLHLFHNYFFSSPSINSNVHFIDREGLEQYMTVSDYPRELEKKMKLLTYFKRYMTEHLVKAGGSTNVETGDVLSRIPHLHTWFRTTCAVVMHLTNGSVQVCSNLSTVCQIENVASINSSVSIFTFLS